MKMIILTSKLSLFDGIRHPKKTNRIISMYYYSIFPFWWISHQRCCSTEGVEHWILYSSCHIHALRRHKQHFPTYFYVVCGVKV